MAQPQVVTRSRLFSLTVNLNRIGTDDVTVLASYVITDPAGANGVGKTTPATPTAQQQTQLKAMWDALVAFINSLEGTS